MEKATRFMAAFEGFEHAHGQTQLEQERIAANKQKAKSRIIRKPLTLETLSLIHISEPTRPY